MHTGAIFVFTPGKERAALHFSSPWTRHGAHDAGAGRAARGGQGAYPPPAPTDTPRRHSAIFSPARALGASFPPWRRRGTPRAPPCRQAGERPTPPGGLSWHALCSSRGRLLRVRETTGRDSTQRRTRDTMPRRLLLLRSCFALAPPGFARRIRRGAGRCRARRTGRARATGTGPRYSGRTEGKGTGPATPRPPGARAAIAGGRATLPGAKATDRHKCTRGDELETPMTGGRKGRISLPICPKFVPKGGFICPKGKEVRGAMPLTSGLVVPPVGFEPTAPGLGNLCSIP